MNQEFRRNATVPPYTRNLAASDQFRWSSPIDVPAIGDDIMIRFNGIGRAEVVGYATVSGYLALMCVPRSPPDWWVRQNGPASHHNAALVFGAEMSPAPTKKS